MEGRIIVKGFGSDNIVRLLRTLCGGYLKNVATGNLNFIKLDKGEDVLGVISSFSIEKNVRSGFLTGIGVVKDVELGYFDVATKNYEVKRFEGEYELLSMMGNIAIADGKPSPHIHVTLSSRDFKCFGGHLLGASVGVTCEIVLAITEMNVERIYDAETGLKLLTPVQSGSKK